MLLWGFWLLLLRERPETGCEHCACLTNCKRSYVCCLSLPWDGLQLQANGQAVELRLSMPPSIPRLDRNGQWGNTLCPPPGRPRSAPWQCTAAPGLPWPPSPPQKLLLPGCKKAFDLQFRAIKAGCSNLGETNAQDWIKLLSSPCASGIVLFDWAWL